MAKDLPSVDAVVCEWFGPFSLHGKARTTIVENPDRTRQFAEFKAFEHGLYFFVGRRGSLPLRRKEILYVGKCETWTFEARMQLHLDPTNSKNEKPKSARLWQIEKIGHLDSIWLGRMANQRVPLDEPVKDSEKLLIYSLGCLFNRTGQLLNETNWNPPERSRVLMHRFNRDLWKSRDVSPWRPHTLPDLMEFDDSTGEVHVTWTGVRAQRGLFGRRCVLLVRKFGKGAGLMSRLEPFAPKLAVGD